MTFLLWSYKKGPGWFFVTCNLLQRTQRRLHQRTPRKLLVRWRSVDWPRWERQKSSSSFAAYSSKASSEVTSESPEETQDLQFKYTDKIRFVRSVPILTESQKRSLFLHSPVSIIISPCLSIPSIWSWSEVLEDPQSWFSSPPLIDPFNEHWNEIRARLKNKKCLALLKKKIDTYQR